MQNGRVPWRIEHLSPKKFRRSLQTTKRRGSCFPGACHLAVQLSNSSTLQLNQLAFTYVAPASWAIVAANTPDGCSRTPGRTCARAVFRASASLTLSAATTIGTTSRLKARLQARNTTPRDCCFGSAAASNGAGTPPSAPRRTGFLSVGCCVIGWVTDFILPTPYLSQKA